MKFQTQTTSNPQPRTKLEQKHSQAPVDPHARCNQLFQQRNKSTTVGIFHNRIDVIHYKGKTIT